MFLNVQRLKKNTKEYLMIHGLIEYGERWYKTSEGSVGWGVSEIVELGAEDISKWEGWHKKEPTCSVHSKD